MITMWLSIRFLFLLLGFQPINSAEFLVEDDAPLDVILSVERQIPDGVLLGMVDSAQGQNLHPFVDNFISVAASADRIFMVEVGALTTNTALLRH